MGTADDPRRPLLGIPKNHGEGALCERHDDSSQPLSHNSTIEHEVERQEDAAEMNYKNMSARTQWIVLALASGACAAFNGVFAKL